MGFCTRRHLFLTFCLIQIICVIERQVFDFLGFLWIPILVNFFQIIFVIFGFFGVYQYRPKYLITYLLWHLLWIAWNVFLICLYLNVAGLDHGKNIILKLDEKSDSWWKKQAPGCKLVNVDDSKYEGCLFDYVYVEVFQSSLQVFLAVFNCIVGTCLSRIFLEEDDTFNFEKPDGPDNFLLHPMYVSYSGSLDGAHAHSNSKYKKKRSYQLARFRKVGKARA